MPQVRTPTGDVIDVEDTDHTALHYYRREPGYEVLGEDGEPEVEVAVVEGEPVDTTPVRPALSALKPEWIDYALAVDPGNAEWINDPATTKDELTTEYGGE